MPTSTTTTTTHQGARASSLLPNAALYRNRRENLARQIRAEGGGVAVLPTAPTVARNADSDYPYRYDSSFYYLSGFTEPDAVLVISARSGQPTVSTLFCRARNPEREVWEGPRSGPENAREQFGLDAAYPFDSLDEHMPGLLAELPAVYYPFGTSGHFHSKIMDWLKRVHTQRRAGVPTQLNDLRSWLGEMRVIKDDHELAIMRRAAQISAQAHLRALHACRPGLREYELEAELLYEFRRQGAQAPAYGSIVAAGANSCILHYPAGNSVINDGDLILIDAACELDGYAADITRTFPANGRFSQAQRELYEIVRAAQQAAIAAIRPGARFDAAHQAAVQVLAQGLRDTGLLDSKQHGSVEDIIESGAYKRFYMHRTSHWLGMDVHDCGNYYDDKGTSLTRKPETGQTNARLSRVLQPGMALTVEPGLYISAADDIPARYRNIGIRIEDDVIVTSEGCEVITRDVPVAAHELEALLRNARVRETR